jgi:hypothetical protein
MSPEPRIEELRAEARYARQRSELYRARMYGLRPTTMSRLRELERIHRGADARLRTAEREHSSAGQPGAPGERPTDGVEAASGGSGG